MPTGKRAHRQAGEKTGEEVPQHLISSTVFYPRPGQETLRITHGQGIYLYDEAGKQYIDCSGAAVILGHGRADVAEILRQQAARIALAPTQYFSTHVLEDYAAAISGIAPPGMNYAWTVSGGTEAVENALKLARQYHYARGESHRYKMIGRWQSYHGSTVGAMDVGGITSRRTIFAPLMRQHPHIPPADCYRCPFGKVPASCAQEHQLDDIVAILRSAMLAISHELHLQQGAAREHSSRQPGQENLRHPEPMEKTLLENAENAKINQNKEEHLCAE